MLNAPILRASSEGGEGEAEGVGDGKGEGEEEGEGERVAVGAGVGVGEGTSVGMGNSSIGNSSIQPAKSVTARIATTASPFLSTLFIIQPFLCTIRFRIKKSFGSTGFAHLIEDNAKFVLN